MRFRYHSCSSLIICDSESDFPSQIDATYQCLKHLIDSGCVLHLHVCGCNEYQLLVTTDEEMWSCYAQYVLAEKHHFYLATPSKSISIIWLFKPARVSPGLMSLEELKAGVNMLVPLKKADVDSEQYSICVYKLDRRKIRWDYFRKRVSCREHVCYVFSHIFYLLLGICYFPGIPSIIALPVANKFGPGWGLIVMIVTMTIALYFLRYIPERYREIEKHPFVRRIFNIKKRADRLSPSILVCMNPINKKPNHIEPGIYEVGR